MPVGEREYMRDVPEYRRLVGKETAASGGGQGDGGGLPPTGFADAPRQPPWWDSLGRERKKQRTRPWAWFLLGVCVTLGGVGYIAENGIPYLTPDEPTNASPLLGPAVLPPGTVAISDGVPVVGRPLRIAIDGKSTFQRGTSVEMSGTSPMHRAGVVAVRLRWNGGRWETVQRTQASADGSYKVRFVLDRPGRAQLRIVFEGGSFAYKWYRVT